MNQRIIENLVRIRKTKTKEVHRYTLNINKSSLILRLNARVMPPVLIFCLFKFLNRLNFILQIHNSKQFIILKK